MPYTCRSLLFALATLLALVWPDNSAIAFGAAPVNVTAVEQYDPHDGSETHCATGAGSLCQVPALCGATTMPLSHRIASRAQRPVGECGAALLRLQPAPPVPIG